MNARQAAILADMGQAVRREQWNEQLARSGAKVWRRFHIYAGRTYLGAWFAETAQAAIADYAEGSTYDLSELRAEAA